MNPASRGEGVRYRRCHFAHGPNWVTHETTSRERWFGLECVRELPGLPPEIVLIPLPGHTRGHCAVAVDTGEGWLLHCGDAYYIEDELSEDGRVPLGIRCFRYVAHVDHSAALLQTGRLKKAMREGEGEITVVATHDPKGMIRAPGDL